MKHLILPRAFSLLMFAKPDSIRYTSSCQVVKDGDEGVIHTLNGRDFYRLLRENGLTPFQEMGLSVVRASVSQAHFRLLEQVLRGVADVNDVGLSMVNGHKLVRAEIVPHGHIRGRACD